jgi:hypothetical protein
LASLSVGRLVIGVKGIAGKISPAFDGSNATREPLFYSLGE